jgi:hypothetical protein
MLRRTLVLLLVVSTAAAQPATRRATNIAALSAHPSFYHQRPIVIVATLALQPNGQLRATDNGQSMAVVFKGSAPDGDSEIRGEFWDLGRMTPDEPRLAAFDVRATFGIDPDGAWPRPGDVVAIIATTVAPAAPPPPTPSIRSLVLHPSRYLDQRVTITGQFSGRNLMGDLPDAPAKSRYDFVLRSADAAIWVTKIQPKGKGFQLGIDSRIDTSRWVQVSGVVQQGRGLQWIDAQPGTLTLAKPPTERVVEEELIRVPAAPPPEVVFSAPTEEESGVLTTTDVRIQMSRDIDQATLRGRIRVSYVDPQGVDGAGPAMPRAPFSVQYTAANRVLELKFAGPLERFSMVKVELLEGILGTDQQPLKPWTLTFGTGGS